MGKFLIILCILFLFLPNLYLALLNGWRLYRVRKGMSLYEKFLEGSSLDFFEIQREIIDLFKIAQIPFPSLPHLEKDASGYVIPVNINIFEQMTFPSPKVTAAVSIAFRQAIGVYKRRFWKSLNPLCWPEFIIFLPRKVFDYFDPQDSKKLKIIRQLIEIVYWIGLTLSSLKYVRW